MIRKIMKIILIIVPIKIIIPGEIILENILGEQEKRSHF